LLDQPFTAGDVDSEVINLKASVHFDAPFEKVEDLNEENSIKININESTLFKNEFSK